MNPFLLDKETVALGGFVYTPQNLADYIELLDGVARTLNGEITGSAARENFKKSWAIFYEQWRGFYADNIGGIAAWINRGFGGTNQIAMRYEKLLKKFSKEAKAEGVVVDVKMNVTPSPQFGFWPKAILLAGGVTVLWLWWKDARE